MSKAISLFFVVGLVLSLAQSVHAQSPFLEKGFREIQKNEVSLEDVAIALFGNLENASEMYTHIDPILDGVMYVYMFYDYPHRKTNLAVMIVTTDPDGTRHWFLKVNDKFKDETGVPRVIKGLVLGGVSDPLLNFWNGDETGR